MYNPVIKNNSSTIGALLSRGVDLKLAEQLSQSGYTLKSLSSMGHDKLSNLGLRARNIENIHKHRPPVPAETRYRLLSLQKHTCCVCRTPHASIVIHHIIPWNKSKSHEIDNLAVLCLPCHDKAHSMHEHTTNLTPEMIRAQKKMWIEQVCDNDIKIIQGDTMYGMQSAMWDYLNHSRLQEHSEEFRNAIRLSEFYESANRRQFLYSGTPLYESPYPKAKNAMISFLRNNRYFHLNNISSRSEVVSIAQENRIVLLTANHRFQPTNSNPAKGPGQVTKCYYQRNRFRFEFNIDKWECTTTSALGNLAGNWICTCVLMIRNTVLTAKCLRISATCLAIGTHIVPFSPNPPPAIPGSFTD